MAEYLVPGEQQITYRSPILLVTSIGCPKGYVIHRENSGILTLRGITQGCNQFARYFISYSGNIALPEGATVGEISVGMTVSGEPETGTIARVTPAAVEEFFNVSAQKYITVPKGCCYNIAFENLSTSQEDITVDNQFNVSVIRVAQEVVYGRKENNESYGYV